MDLLDELMVVLVLSLLFQLFTWFVIFFLLCRHHIYTFFFIYRFIVFFFFLKIDRLIVSDKRFIFLCQDCSIDFNQLCALYAITGNCHYYMG